MNPFKHLLLGSALLGAAPCFAQDAEQAPPEDDATCAEPFVLVMQAKNDTENFYLAEAQSEVEQAIAEMGCAPMVSKDLLGQLWQAQGMISILNGDIEGGKAPLAAAFSVSPNTWNVNYGDDAKQHFIARPAGAGTLALRGAGKAKVAIDGELAEAPYELTTGLHLIQVGKDLPEHAEFASVVTIRPDETVTLSAKVASQVIPAGGLPEPEPSNGSSIILAAAAGGVLIASAVTMGLAGSANKKFIAEPDEDAAGKHLKANHTLNITGGVLGVAGLGLGGVAVVNGQW